MIIPMPNISWKVWLAIGVILLFAALLLIIWWQKSIIDKQKTIEQSMVEMKALQNGVVRNQAQYVTKSQLKDFAEQANIDLKDIKKDAKKLGAEVEGIASAISVTPGTIQHGLPSTSTTPREEPSKPIAAQCPDGSSVECPNPDQYGYLNKMAHLKLEEPLSESEKIPWGEVTFKAWQEKPWDLSVYSRNYKATTVLAEDENGRHYAYSKLYIETNGNKYALPIADARLVEQFPKAKFRFDPRLFLSMYVGTHVNPKVSFEWTPALQLFLFSRGKTKRDPDWIFLGLGPGFEVQDQKAALVLSPFSYNVASHLPLVKNIYIGPSVGLDTKGSFTILGGFNIGL